MTVEEAIIDIVSDTISPDYFSDGEDLHNYVSDDSKSIIVYDNSRPYSERVWELDSKDDLEEKSDSICGVCIYGSYSKEEYDQSINVDINEIIENTELEEEDFPVNVFKLIAVDESYQKTQASTKLISASLKDLLKDPPVLTMVWGKPLDSDISNINLAEKHANKRLGIYENYTPDGWRCQACGFNNECNCSSELFAFFADERRES